MNRIRVWTIAVLIGLGALSGCDRTQPPEVIATWNNGSITVGDLDGFLMRLPAGQRFPAEDEDPQTWLEDRTTDLFVRTVFGRDDVDLSAEAGYARALELGSRAVLAGEFLRKRQGSFQVSEADARQFYELHLDAWRQPERRAFLHIFIAAKGAENVEDACNEATALRESILAGTSFEETARLHSDSANAATGGLVAPVTRAQLRPEIAAAVFSTPAGHLSEAIPSPAGCNLFKVAQVVPLIEPSFEQLSDRILHKLVSDHRAEWRSELFEEQMAAEQLAIPPWMVAESALPEFDSDDEVLLRIGDDTVTWGDLKVRMRSVGTTAMETARELATELVFSRALRRDDPSQADQLMETAQIEANVRFLSAHAFREFAQTIPEEDLHHHWETHQGRFQNEPKLSLTLYSWPIAPGDPLESLEAPGSLAKQLRRRPREAEALWTAISDGSGSRREIIPETDFRTLAGTRPTLSHTLLAQLAENDVVGPYRFGNRLWVAHITHLTESHPLAYEDAVSRVRVDYLASHSSVLRAGWRQSLVEKHGFLIIHEHLENFGANLVKTLQGGTI